VSRRVRLSLPAAVVLCGAIALALAGCGGSGKKHAARVGAATVCAYPSGVKISSYEPSGKLIADSGFRPDPNGFGAPNYGNCGQANMGPGNMQALFGDAVCASGSGSSCELSTVAQHWMDVENSKMSGGHCMGFSVTALRFFDGNLKPSDYGADKTYDLAVKGNSALQGLIAEDWTFQDLASINSNALAGTPNQVLTSLKQALGAPSGSNRSSAYPSNKELYTIGIYRVGANGPEGHAITPYAIEDKGGGKYAVLVYDNNYPGVTQAMNFDTNANTWSYQAALIPGAPSDLYSGDADHPDNLALFPTSPGTQTQTCPSDVCGESSGTAGGAIGAAVKSSAQAYNDITLLGNPTNHAHLVLRDGKGRVTGFLNGKLLEQIPGVKVRPVVTFSYNEVPEPTYEVPVTTDVTATIDATDLKKADKERVTLLGPSFYVEVSDIMLQPGEHDTMAFSGDGTGFGYGTDSRHSQTPLLLAGVVDKTGTYAFAAQAFGIKGGSIISLYLNKKAGAFILDTTGTKGAIKRTGGYAVYNLDMVRVNKRGTATWAIGKTPILLKHGWKATVLYRKAPAAGKELPVYTGPPKGPLPIQFLEPQH
jgi:hypothetical protein